eukprot:361603-Chlamydomonas_euryale.AAC.5
MSKGPAGTRAERGERAQGWRPLIAAGGSGQCGTERQGHSRNRGVAQKGTRLVAARQVWR